MDLDIYSGLLNYAIAIACIVLAVVSVAHLLIYRRAMTAWTRNCTYALLAFFALAGVDRFIGAGFRIASVYILNPALGGEYPAAAYLQVGLRTLMALVLWGLILYAVTHHRDRERKGE